MGFCEGHVKFTLSEVLSITCAMDVLTRELLSHLREFSRDFVSQKRIILASELSVLFVLVQTMTIEHHSTLILQSK